MSERDAGFDDGPTGSATPSGPPVEQPDPVMVVMRFDTDRVDELTGVLARYVVLARSHPGCRNVDFVTSATTAGRLLVVQKWETLDAQQRHFDSTDMIEMAQACNGLLARPPEIDLYTGISMHDLA